MHTGRPQDQGGWRAALHSAASEASPGPAAGPAAFLWKHSWHTTEFHSMTQPWQLLADVRLCPLAAQDRLHLRTVASKPARPHSRLPSKCTACGSGRILPETQNTGSATGRHNCSPISAVTALTLPVTAPQRTGQSLTHAGNRAPPPLARRKMGLIKTSVISHLISH